MIKSSYNSRSVPRGELLRLKTASDTAVDIYGFLLKILETDPPGHEEHLIYRIVNNWKMVSADYGSFIHAVAHGRGIDFSRVQRFSAWLRCSSSVGLLELQCRFAAGNELLCDLHFGIDNQPRILVSYTQAHLAKNLLVGRE